MAKRGRPVEPDSTLRADDGFVRMSVGRKTHGLIRELADKSGDKSLAQCVTRLVLAELGTEQGDLDEAPSLQEQLNDIIERLEVIERNGCELSLAQSSNLIRLILSHWHALSEE